MKQNKTHINKSFWDVYWAVDRDWIKTLLFFYLNKNKNTNWDIKFYDFYYKKWLICMSCKKYTYIYFKIFDTQQRERQPNCK
jgi:hypothetical protein